MTTEIPAEAEGTQETQEETQEIKETPTLRNADYARRRIEAKKEKEGNNEMEVLRQELADIKASMAEKPTPSNPSEAYIKDLEAIKIRNEVSDFVTERPEFAKYKAKIIELAKVSDLNYEYLAFAVAGKDLERIGAISEKQASQEASETTTSGGTSSNTMNKKEKSLKDSVKDAFLADYNLEN